MTKYRVALMTKYGEILSLNCETREEADQFILENNATRFRIKDNNLDKVIETEQGIIGKNTDETN